MKTAMMTLLALFATTAVASAWWGTSPEDKLKKDFQTQFNNKETAVRLARLVIPSGEGYDLKSSTVLGLNFLRVTKDGFSPVPMKDSNAVVIRIQFAWVGYFEGAGKTTVDLVYKKEHPTADLELLGHDIVQTDVLSDEAKAAQAAVGAAIFLDALTR